MTDLAQTKAIAELDRLRTDGHDPVQVINQSIINGWKGLFPLKHRAVGAPAPATRQDNPGHLPRGPDATGTHDGYATRDYGQNGPL